MRILKICDTLINTVIADKDLSDYKKGVKALHDCDVKELKREIYKFIDVDFIKYIEYNDDSYFTIYFKDNTEMQLDKIHLYKVVNNLGRIIE